MNQWDPFEELEVSRNATDEVIQAAYRRLARKFHPDSGEAPDAARMVRLNRAYETVRSMDRGHRGFPRATSPIEQLVDRAENAADVGDWSLVGRLAGEILSVEPGNVRALLLKLEIEVTQGRWESAEMLVDEILQIEPNNEEALLFAAESAIGEGDWLLARGYAASTLVLSPENKDARAMWDSAQKALSDEARV